MKHQTEDEERLSVYEEVHLRGKQDLSNEEKIDYLRKKNRNKSIHFIINIVIVLFFILMLVNEQTTFGDWFYYVLFGVFALNMILIYFQKKQIVNLIDDLVLKVRSE
tara:strand:- start:36555 stop:36875 length:321 start_codon:yes stop_codon:yes gene_type:complete